jgi:hypothetical protein
VLGARAGVDGTQDRRQTRAVAGDVPEDDVVGERVVSIIKAFVSSFRGADPLGFD